MDPIDILCITHTLRQIVVTDEVHTASSKQNQFSFDQTVDSQMEVNGGKGTDGATTPSNLAQGNAESAKPQVTMDVKLDASATQDMDTKLDDPVAPPKNLSLVHSQQMEPSQPLQRVNLSGQVHVWISTCFSISSYYFV